MHPVYGISPHNCHKHYYDSERDAKSYTQFHAGKVHTPLLLGLPVAGSFTATLIAAV
jgi:hypothetical protein